MEEYSRTTPSSSEENSRIVWQGGLWKTFCGMKPREIVRVMWGGAADSSKGSVLASRDVHAESRSRPSS